MKNIQLILCICFTFLEGISSFPEQGKWSKSVNQDSQYVGITKSMYNLTQINVKVKCDSYNDEQMEVKISWVLRKTPCWKEYLLYNEENEFFHKQLFDSPESSLPYLSGNTYQPHILKSDEVVMNCDHTIVLPEVDGRKMYKAAVQKKVEVDYSTSSPEEDKDAFEENDASKVKEVMGGIRVKRQSNNESDDQFSISLPSTSGDSRSKHPVVTVYSDGVYLFMLRVSPVNDGDKFNATVEIDAFSSYGYLAASDYPLLVFYSVMCVVYALYGAVWLIFCVLRWKDLLRLQYWIAAVIFLGLIEKAAFVAEYESLNEHGYSLRGVLEIAELISCAKRTVARILVLIVALGFGIVKPRLGTMLHRVLGLGLLYFIIASIESVTRALTPKTDPSKQTLLALIPLALLDSLICWWVFSALVSTTRVLRLRRNPTKLSVYTHFTNVLAATVIASVCYMFWSIRYHQYEECLQDWKELWVDIAFWHFLFALLLLGIMLLWRPTNNNQRFAFSPLLDEESDGEEIEHLMGGGLSEDTKHRTRTNSEERPSPRVSTNTAEDDLKWVEDNIPSSLADASLPILDSDEEIMTTRFEMSKMQ